MMNQALIDIGKKSLNRGRDLPHILKSRQLAEVIGKQIEPSA